MPLYISLKPGPIRLSDWIDKQRFEEVDRNYMVELFEEDIIALLDDCGGLASIIDRVWWQDD